MLPHHLVSRVVYRVTRSSTRLTPAMIRTFSRLFGIDLSEAKLQLPEDYKTFNAFFTRELKPDARPVDQTDNGLCSPVDGCVSQIGSIDRDQIFQAKGFRYSTLDLLGGRQSDATAFNDGNFATLYLSPRDYHRIHMPLDATLVSMHYVPGRLFSVAPHTVRTIPRLFARNERVVALFDTAAGKLAMVLVGAINVAAIETVWAGVVTPPTSPRINYRDYHESEKLTLNKGTEMGRFNMGSTVILLVEQGVGWDNSLCEGSTVRMGELIGQFQ